MVNGSQEVQQQVIIIEHLISRKKERETKRGRERQKRGSKR